jgi:hypothetical protein
MTPGGKTTRKTPRDLRSHPHVEFSEVAEVGKPIAEVQTSAVQFRDGSINASDDPPQIQVYTYTDNGLGSTQARELAAVLIEAADEVDRWAAK